MFGHIHSRPFKVCETLKESLWSLFQVNFSLHTNHPARLTGYPVALAVVMATSRCRAAVVVVRSHSSRCARKVRQSA